LSLLYWIGRRSHMARYYFDLTKDGDLVPDEEGTELPTIECAREECAYALAEIAKGALPGTSNRELVITVKLEAKPVLKARLLYEATFLV
jgi:hypothetical protein